MQKHKILNKALSYNLIHINISGELSDYTNSTDLTAKLAAGFDLFLIFKILFIWEGQAGEEQRERNKWTLHWAWSPRAFPIVPMSLRSQPQLKPRVGPSTDLATQVPHPSTVFKVQ